MAGIGEKMASSSRAPWAAQSHDLFYFGVYWIIIICVPRAVKGTAKKRDWISSTTRAVFLSASTANVDFPANLSAVAGRTLM
jgi:hypothetical protein